MFSVDGISSVIHHLETNRSFHSMDWLLLPVAFVVSIIRCNFSFVVVSFSESGLFTIFFGFHFLGLFLSVSLPFSRWPQIISIPL